MPGGAARQDLRLRYRDLARCAGPLACLVSRPQLRTAGSVLDRGRRGRHRVDRRGAPLCDGLRLLVPRPRRRRARATGRCRCRRVPYLGCAKSSQSERAAADLRSVAARYLFDRRVQLPRVRRRRMVADWLFDERILVDGGRIAAQESSRWRRRMKMAGVVARHPGLLWGGSFWRHGAKRAAGWITGRG